MPSTFFHSDNGKRRTLFRKSNRSVEGLGSLPARTSTTSDGQQYPALPNGHQSNPKSQATPASASTHSPPSIVDIPRMRPMPVLTSFDNNTNGASAFNEPLINDIATRNIPEQFRPQQSRKDDDSVFSVDSVADAAQEARSLPVRKISIARSDKGATASLAPDARKDQLRENNNIPKIPDTPRLISPRQPQHFVSSSSTPTGPDSHPFSSGDSIISYETSASSVPQLPRLQEKALYEDLGDDLDPLGGDDPGNFNLLAPPTNGPFSAYSLEERSEQMFSEEHLQEIFDDSTTLLRFTSFLGTHRPRSMPLLEFYLDAMKAVKAINYANSITDSLPALTGHAFSEQAPASTTNSVLDDKVRAAFSAMAQEDLPAYVTHVFVQVVTTSISRRVMGTLPPHLREASEGLAEVFCLTDPSRPDNPIIFSSEEFHRTTQYGVNYVIGRNCRFLQGPRTNSYSVDRLRMAVKAGREHSEVFLNYRRDGSPFLNLLMMAPLLDNKGEIRYFIGAQVDVSGLARDCTDLEGLQKLLTKQELTRDEVSISDHTQKEQKSAFQELSETLSSYELDVVRRTGGRMHREVIDEKDDTQFALRPRLLIKDTSPDLHKTGAMAYGIGPARPSGKLEGIYQNYLLIRPYPSLRILFSSPSLRVPGMLQSSFMSRIGGSARVREELTAAMAEGRGVTAKVRWISGKADDEGRPRWIHCTPLLGHTGAVGVWMIVIVDDDSSRAAMTKKTRVAPPVTLESGSTRQGTQKYAPPAIPLIPTGNQGNVQQPRKDSSVRSTENTNEGASSLNSFHLG